jgi:hypothetical protein
MARRSAAVAGIEPVEPAAIIGPAGAAAASRAASLRISMSRRAAGSARPASARIFGHSSPAIFRKSSVSCQ